MAQNASALTAIVATTTSCPLTLTATDTEAIISVGAGTWSTVTGKVQASANGTDYVDWPSYDVNGASVSVPVSVSGHEVVVATMLVVALAFVAIGITPRDGWWFGYRADWPTGEVVYPSLVVVASGMPKAMHE